MLGAGTLQGCASQPAAGGGKVVVVGGGFAGATAAKYVRLLSDHKINTVLIEPSDAFVSCPISNLVLGGSKQIGDLTTAYTGLGKTHGVTVVRDMEGRETKEKKFLES